jgi:hypothetical protein
MRLDGPRRGYALHGNATCEGAPPDSPWLRGHPMRGEASALMAAPGVAFSRTCIAEVEFVLGSCDSVWPRAMVQPGRGALSDLCLVHSNSLRVLRLEWHGSSRLDLSRRDISHYHVLYA